MQPLGPAEVPGAISSGWPKSPESSCNVGMALTTRKLPDSRDDFSVLLNGWMQVGRIYKSHHTEKPWLWFISGDQFVYRFKGSGGAATFDKAKAKLAMHLRAGFEREGIDEETV